MWILIALAVVVVLALAFWLWRRSPQVADDVQQWKHGLDVLGRTAERPAADGPAPTPSDPEDIGDSVRVLERPSRDDED